MYSSSVSFRRFIVRRGMSILGISRLIYKTDIIPKSLHHRYKSFVDHLVPTIDDTADIRCGSTDHLCHLRLSGVAFDAFGFYI